MAEINPVSGNMVDIEVNPQADYSTGKSQSIIAQRSHVKIAPKYGGNYKQGDIVRIEIPSTNYLDSELTTLSFNLKLYQKAGGDILPQYWNPVTDGAIDGSWGRVRNAAQCVFNRVKLLQGSNVIEDIQDYGVLYKILTVATAPKSWRDTTGMLLEGYGDEENFWTHKQHRTWGSRTNATDLDTVNSGSGAQGGSTEGHRFDVQLNLGLLARAGKYLPLKYTGQFTIELYMETNVEALISSVGAGVASVGTSGATRIPASVTSALPVASEQITYPFLHYEIDQVNLHCHFIVPIEEYDKSVLEQIQGGGIDIHFDTYSSHTKQTSSERKQTHNFQERAVSVRGGYAVLRNQQDIDDLRTDFIFSSNNMEEFQWKLGSQYIPSQQVDCRYGAAEAFIELQDSFSATGDLLSTGTINSDNFNPELKVLRTGGSNADAHELRVAKSRPYNFIMGLNLEKTTGQLSGFNTSATNTDIELIMNFPSRVSSAFRDINSTAGDGSQDVPIFNGDYSASTDPQMVTKTEANTYSRINFYAHIDTVFKINGVGSIEVLR